MNPSPLSSWLGVPPELESTYQRVLALMQASEALAPLEEGVGDRALEVRAAEHRMAEELARSLADRFHELPLAEVPGGVQKVPPNRGWFRDQRGRTVPAKVLLALGTHVRGSGPSTVLTAEATVVLDVEGDLLLARQGDWRRERELSATLHRWIAPEPGRLNLLEHSLRSRGTVRPYGSEPDHLERYEPHQVLRALEETMQRRVERLEERRREFATRGQKLGL